MLVVAWKFYLQRGTDADLGHIISSVPLHHKVFRSSDTRHPQRDGLLQGDQAWACDTNSNNDNLMVLVVLKWGLLWWLGICDRVILASCEPSKDLFLWSIFIGFFFHPLHGLIELSAAEPVHGYQVEWWLSWARELVGYSPYHSWRLRSSVDEVDVTLLPYFRASSTWVSSSLGLYTSSIVPAWQERQPLCFFLPPPSCVSPWSLFSFSLLFKPCSQRVPECHCASGQM